jgi:hypothetical protein
LSVPDADYSRAYLMQIIQERTWCRLFKACVVCTKLDIYRFISLTLKSYYYVTLQSNSISHNLGTHFNIA